MVSRFSKKAFHALMACALICLLTPSSQAAGSGPAPGSRMLAIQLGAPFCDNAILQRDMGVPVWGWSKPGTEVTVDFAGQKKTATAGKDGKWMLKLDKLKASFEPREMVITESAGKKETLKNLLVGEVWLASGQSNMQHACPKTTCLQIKVAPVGDAKVNPIREFEVKGTTAQLHPIEKSTGHWKDGEVSTYSAIALAFAEKLYRELNVPIGILNCSWSQTPIEAWVPRVGWAAAEDDYSKEIHEKCLITDPRTPEHQDVWAVFYKSLERQIAENEERIKKGEKAKEITEDVPGNMRGNRDANWLFSGRLNPVVPYAIRGAIWNQGWANRHGGLHYYTNLHTLINGWRIVWDRQDLPVYFHQFYCPDETSKPSIDSTAEMRLATWMARDIPNTGMASQIDIGGAIHYRNKAVPGRRLALQALNKQYGKKVVADGPMFKSYEANGDKVIVTFDCADGGLVVGDTAYNRNKIKKNNKDGGFADPKIIENGENKVTLFWLAGEDRIWHPATFKIDGDKVVVTSKDVKEPRGVSYASGGIGFQPCLYNKDGLLPMTPFIQYDNKMVTTKWWPDSKLKIAEETVDPSTVGKIYEYRKLPLLAVQFRDNAVLQADKPVKIWGSTRKYGEWQAEDEEGDCKVHFEFGPSIPSEQGAIKKTIPVEKGMDEWSVTLPPMKAGRKKYSLKVQFTIDGELVHERVANGIVFGDVWYVAVPASLKAPAKGNKKDGETFVLDEAGPIVRMMMNESKGRSRSVKPSRYSVCVSRTPLIHYASYWKPASGLANTIGARIAAKTKRPVGIIWLQTRLIGKRGKEGLDKTTLAQWMAPEFLKNSPSTMDDYKTVGSQYPDNPYYLANVRRYTAEWKDYWEKYVPEMIEKKAVPEGAKWGDNWGQYPSPSPEIGDSWATQIYNIYVHPFAPTVVKGVIFLTGDSMVKEAEGSNFGPEMSAVANCFKSKFEDKDVPFIYTIPAKSLATGIAVPKKIDGANTAVEISDWADISGVIDAVLKLNKRRF